jgi:hypothetical protein
MNEDTPREPSTEEAEQRSLTTDVAIGLGPTVAVATGWALDHFGSHGEDSPKEPPKSESHPPPPGDSG